MCARRVVLACVWCCGAAALLVMSFAEQIRPLCCGPRESQRQACQPPEAHLVASQRGEVVANRVGGCMGGEVGRAIAPAAPPMAAAPRCGFRRPMRIALLHVGKSAGTALTETLREGPVNVTRVHINADRHFDAAAVDVFVVTTRDPVARVISAFNWNHPIGGGPTSAQPHDDERRMYVECFPELPGGVSAFAEALSAANRTACAQLARRCFGQPTLCRHIGRSLSWYLPTSTLRRLRSGVARALLVRFEHFEADVARLWAALCVPPERRPRTVSHTFTRARFPRRGDTRLSALARSNLRAFTAAELKLVRELSRLELRSSADGGAMQSG